MTRKKNRKNIDHELQLLADWRNIAVSMFEWKGLPNEMPKYVPERYLYEQGQCCALKLPGTEDIAILPVSYGSEKLDIYGRPEQWRAYAVGNSPQADIIRNTVLNNENSVLIWNDQNRNGTEGYIKTIVHKMVALDTTLDQNCLIQRTPIAVIGNSKNQLTATNIMKEISDGSQFIFDQGMNIQDNVEVINLGVPFIGAELSDQYETYHNRILRYLGIDHLPVEKQERMLTGEASGNDDEIEIRKTTRLEYRKLACEQMKDVFGLDVEVSYVEPEPEPIANTPAMPGTQDASAEARGPTE